MLAETGFGHEIWAEATSTAVYLINRTPNFTIGFKLPEELWSGQEPELSHLRRFGCSAYVHTIKEKKNPRAVEGTFVGYPFGVKGYRVWMQDEGKCVTSRNVVFDEDEVYKDTLVPKEAKALEKIALKTDGKRKNKRVTFSDDLLQGPSKRNVEHGETSGQGGDISRSDDSDDYDPENTDLPETDSESSDEENQSSSKGNQSLDEYVLA